MKFNKDKFASLVNSINTVEGIKALNAVSVMTRTQRDARIAEIEALIEELHAEHNSLTFRGEEEFKRQIIRDRILVLTLGEENE